MSTKNKNIASQALLEMDAITSAIKEESKKSLNTLLSEAVKTALRESCDEDDDKGEVIDNEEEESTTEKKPSDKKKNPKQENEAGNPEMDGDEQPGNEQMAQQPMPQQMGGQQGAPEESPEMMGGEQMPQENPGEGEESWDDFSDYQVGDSNTYDLTGENDYDTVVKVYKLLNDEDQVVVRKDGNTLQLQDNEAGTEYVIDLGGDGEEPEATAENMGGEEMPDELNESLLDGDDFDGIKLTDDFIDDEPFEDDFTDDQTVIGHEEDDPFIYGDYEDHRNEDLGDFNEFDDDDMAGFDDELYEGKIRNNKKARKPMKESKEVLFEVDLGYTDNYQDKDPIAGLSNNEPSKGGKSWHKGVPTGTKKPWAGETKSKGDPFKNTQKVEGSVNEEDLGAEALEGAEMEEQKNVGGFVQQNSVTASNIPNSNGRKARSQRGTDVQVTGSANPRYSSTNESRELKAIKNENKELKKAIMELRKNLNEAYITNVNLGKITKLFLENTTSQQEKIDIVNRFSNEAKTVEQSNVLYESIDKQLKKNQQINLNESSATAKGTKELNEQKIYKTNDLMKTIDLMGRVLSC